MGALPPQHADQHRPEYPILLAVDQQIREGATIRVSPELADPIGTVEVREAENVEEAELAQDLAAHWDRSVARVR
jgi:hypothetical protein